MLRPPRVIIGGVRIPKEGKPAIRIHNATKELSEHKLVTRRMMKNKQNRYLKDGKNSIKMPKKKNEDDQFEVIYLNKFILGLRTWLLRFCLQGSEEEKNIKVR